MFEFQYYLIFYLTIGLAKVTFFYGKISPFIRLIHSSKNNQYDSIFITIKYNFSLSLVYLRYRK